MTLSGEGWTVREHSPDAWYAGRPVGQMLGGQNNKPGTAAAALRILAGQVPHLDSLPRHGQSSQQV